MVPLVCSSSTLFCQSDAVNALWEAADLGSREDATFLDIVDFCFTCALLFDIEKQVTATTWREANGDEITSVPGFILHKTT